MGGVEDLRPLRVLGYGRAFDIAAPTQLARIARRLCELASAPDRGTPFSLTFYVSVDGEVAGADLNFAGRIVFDAAGNPAETRALTAEEVRPTAEQWRRELTDHPRSPEHVPSWWQAIADGDDGAYEPSMPSWFGGPMPQSLDEAAAQAKLLVPKFEGLLHFVGYAAIADELVRSIHATARTLRLGELDAIFGRRGRGAQEAAQARLAATAVGTITPLLAERTAAERDEMIRAWHGHSRDDGPDTTMTSDEQLRVAVTRVAERIVARRFGTLPKNWHVV
ncbi:hypothetical protein [Microlunatus sp. Y2014]|uniref:hypothetical protein n=1 Tax=Microlunatus sp. Y2014 TaxID=3418488 RepID=UPI003DA7371C